MGVHGCKPRRSLHWLTLLANVGAKYDDIRMKGISSVPRFVRRYPWVGATLVMLVAYGVLWLSGLGVAAHWVGGFYVAAFILVTAYGMLRDILRGHWGLDILAVVAMVSTLLVGETLASLIVVLMLSGGEALEDFAQRRAARDLENLLSHAPAIVHVLDTAGERYTDVAVDDVKVGDLLLVKPAEIVPADSELVSASGSFDESSLTGESLPVSKMAGDEVLSGVVNGAEAVTVRVIRAAKDSQFQQIVALITEAENDRAPIVRLADRFAVPFTALSLLIGAVAWFVSGEPTRFAEVMVLATPCPLLIAAPVAFIGGQAQASRNGVIVKSGAVLEQLARVRTALFDKTGTLTRGTPQVAEVVAASGFDAPSVLRLAASAEQYSSHVIASSIIRHAREVGLDLVVAHHADEVATNGVHATVDGHDVIVGKRSYVESVAGQFESPELGAGQAAAYVSIDGRYAGTILLSDAMRTESRAVVKWLKDNGVQNVAILTGDNERTARHIAAEAGIDTVYADLLPADKVRLAAEAKPGPALMVGDGVNDAPVLARADVGIAIGSSSATAASDAADGVVLRNNIRSIAELVAISKHTVAIALTAIWMGILMSIGLMLIAATGAIAAVFGALTQEIVDLVAILFALLALRAPASLRKLREIPITAPARTQQLTPHP